MKFDDKGIVVFRRRVLHTCKICGIEFVGYVNALYCSNRCRQAAKYRRNKAKKVSDKNA